MSFYAVRKGRKRSIYETWNECESQVYDFYNPLFCKFDTFEGAEDFMNEKCKLKKLPSYQAKQFKKTEKPLLFEVTTDGSIVAYIHGDWVNDSDFCCSFGSDQSSVGFGVFWADKHPYNASRLLDDERDGNQPNRAKIQAAILAIRKAKWNGYKKIVIRTDSDYLISSATCWIDRWLENGWKTFEGTPVVNKHDFQLLNIAMTGMERVTWEKVHKGIYGYDMAVELMATNMKISVKC